MKIKILEFITSSVYYNKTVGFLKSIKLKNGRIRLYDVVKILLQNLQRDEILERASGVAFSFTLSIFPAVIFLFTLIPYIPIEEDFRGYIMDFLQQVMPASTYEAASSTIEEILSIPRGDLLSFGFLFALYFATNGMVSLMQAFNRCYKTPENRNFLKTVLIATLLVFVLAFVLFFAVIFLIVGEQTLTFLVNNSIIQEGFTVIMIQFLRIIIIFLIFYFAISFIYYYAPVISDEWRFFSSGSFLASILSIIVSFGFSFYINNFGTYNKLYGSIGALIAIMLWFYFLSVILLVGFELNASIDKALRDKEKARLQDLEDSF